MILLSQSSQAHHRGISYVKKRGISSFRLSGVPGPILYSQISKPWLHQGRGGAALAVQHNQSPWIFGVNGTTKGFMTCRFLFSSRAQLVAITQDFASFFRPRKCIAKEFWGLERSSTQPQYCDRGLGRVHFQVFHRRKGSPTFQN